MSTCETRPSSKHEEQLQLLYNNPHLYDFSKYDLKHPKYYSKYSAPEAKGVNIEASYIVADAKEIGMNTNTLFSYEKPGIQLDNYIVKTFTPLPLKN